MFVNVWFLCIGILIGIHLQISKSAVNNERIFKGKRTTKDDMKEIFETSGRDRGSKIFVDKKKIMISKPIDNKGEFLMLNSFTVKTLLIIEKLNREL